jgi:hypothetical protein
MLLNEERAGEFVHEKMKILRKVKDFLQISDLIRSRGFFFVSMKGPLLSQRIYGDPTVRFSHDIDIFINPEDLDGISELLYGAGFSIPPGYLWTDDKVKRKLLMESYHHLEFVNKKTGLMIEVHWVLMHTLPVSEEFVDKILRKNLCEMEFAGQKFTVMNKEMELLFLLIHGSRHGWERLKWLVDIKDYPCKDMDVPKFYDLVEKFRAGRILGQTNRLLTLYFGTSLPFPGNCRVPENYVRGAVKQIEAEDISPGSKSFKRMVANFVYLYRMFPGVGYKIEILKLHMFRPADMASLKSTKKLSYYLYRPYGLIKRRMFHA